jgi:AAA15 family ATPase/GTPase
MAINRVEIKDFLVFKGEFAVDFCPGVNVLIGANATGKTTLIKYMYWWSGNYKYRDWETNPDSNSLFTGIEHYFGSLQTPKIVSSLPDITADKDEYKRVFIPEKDMLSNSKGLFALYNNRDIPFEKQYIDILGNAQLPATRIVSPLCQSMLNIISDVISGEVLYDNDTFFINKLESGEKFPFSWEASGFRKFGLLWKLLRNGLLESGSILFWDEPENSLNPELLPVLVDILLELQRAGVQIFIATHNSNLAQLFDVKRTDKDSLLFCNLSKNDDGTIRCDSAANYTELPKSVLEDADEALYKAVVAKAMGVNANE